MIKTAANPATDEVKRLQGCIDDLIRIQAMPAIWTGLDTSRIVDTLLDMLIRVLNLDFTCARVHDADAGAPVVTVRLPQGGNASARLRRTRALAAWWKAYRSEGVRRVANPIGTGDIAIAPVRMGLREEIGLFVAASTRAGFPSNLETIVLRVAANQAVIGLREGRTLRSAEERLRRSEAQLAADQKLSHTGSWGWNVGTGEMIFSRETAQILGLDPDLPAPAFAAAIELIHSDDRPFVQRIMDSATRDEKAYEFEARACLPDGSVKYVRCVGRPFRNQSGQLEFVGTLLDVTDRKLTEDSLHAAQAQLAHVGRLTTMEGLAASVAHEINQPLAAVITDAHAGLRWLALAKPNLAEVRSALSRIVSEANRASQVIAAVRGFVKKSPATVSVVPLNQMIDGVLSLTRRQILAAGVSLRTHLAPDLRTATGDPVQLQQVLVNLVVNAIDAIQARDEGPRELLISSWNEGEANIVVAVRDSGQGLDPNASEKLFQAFFTTKRDGVGLGLSISQSIVEAHGGRIWATPNAGPGATFQFSLPTANAVV